MSPKRTQIPARRHISSRPAALHGTMGLVTAAMFFIVSLVVPTVLVADDNQATESPQSFVSRKLSNYKAGTNALKAKYDEFCRMPGQKFVQPPAGLPPQGVFLPGGGVFVPGGIPQDGIPGAPKLVETPGTLIIESVEIEQVINTWYTTSTWGTGNNPFSWNDVTRAFQPQSTSSSSSSSSGGGGGGTDNCSGQMIALSGGGTAYIVLNHLTKTCSLSNTSSGAILVSGVGAVNYAYSSEASWGGASGSLAYGSPTTDVFSKGGVNVTITFTVTNMGGSLSVSSISWW